MLTHHPLQQGFLANEQTAEKRCCKEPVDDSRLPFDEDGIVQNQGRPAQNQHQPGGDQGHFFHPALPQPQPADLGQGSDDQHAGGDVNVSQLISGEKQRDGQEVEQQFHAGGPSSVADRKIGQKKGGLVVAVLTG